jgi:integrase
VRKLPSGRWQASYLGPDLVRRTAPHTFDAKADAEGWLGRRREEVVSGEWQPPVKVERVAALTFDAYATQWLRERALKPRTREGYEHLLGRYLLPVLGPMAIDAITPSVVRTWWSRLPADKPTVRARSYALLKAVMNTAVADEVIDSNPCRIRGAANTPRAREIRPATIEELEVIVEAMPDRFRALVLLCAWCALRSGEVLELRRRDLDVAAGTVRVVRALPGSAVSRLWGRRSPRQGRGWSPYLRTSSLRSPTTSTP